MSKVKSAPMFKIVAERTAWQPVTFPGLTEDGEGVENEIEMQFKLLTSDENLDFFGEVSDFKVTLSDHHEMPRSVRAAKLMSQIVRDWRGVGEANGDPIKFSEEALARFFNVPATFEAVLRAYAQAVNGGKDARAGN